MTMPKLVPLPLKDGDSLRKWKLIEDWYYEFDNIKILIKKGFVTDFASIPRMLRSLYSPTGYLLIAALVHDYCYQNGGYHEIFVEFPQTFFIQQDRRRADMFFRRIANIEHPSRKVKTEVAYKTLRVSGWVAWDRHRKSKGRK